MKTSFRLLPMLALFAAVVVASGCATTSVRQHPEFAAAKRTVKTVAVLPPEVEFRQIVFTGENERDSLREATISSELSSAVQTALEQRGYTANMDLQDRLKEGDKQFNFDYEQLKTAYAQASKELYQRNQVTVDESAKFKVGLGPIANAFTAASGADALVLVRYWGFDKSGGQVTKEIIAGALLGVLTGFVAIPGKSGSRLEVAVVDGVSGEVLWANTLGGPSTPAAILQRAVATLPAAREPRIEAAEAAPKTGPKVEQGAN